MAAALLLLSFIKSLAAASIVLRIISGVLFILFIIIFIITSANISKQSKINRFVRSHKNYSSLYFNLTETGMEFKDGDHNAAISVNGEKPVLAGGINDGISNFHIFIPQDDLDESKTQTKVTLLEMSPKISEILGCPVESEDETFVLKLLFSKPNMRYVLAYDSITQKFILE